MNVTRFQQYADRWFALANPAMASKHGMYYRLTWGGVGTVPTGSIPTGTVPTGSIPVFLAWLLTFGHSLYV